MFPVKPNPVTFTATSNLVTTEFRDNVAKLVVKFTGVFKSIVTLFNEIFNC
jgi:hypothetical protein